MADNTTLNLGTGGDVISTDDISGVKVQRVKIQIGADGSASDVHSGNPLPVDTELPAAAALADGASNPTTPTLGAALLGYNGTTFDRLRSDTTNGLDVDVTRLPALPAGTNNIGDVDIASDATHVTEDAVAASNPSGPQLMVRTRTSPGVEVSTSGDHAALTGPVEGGVWAALIGDGVPAQRIGSGTGTATAGLRVVLASDSPGAGDVAVEDAAAPGNPTGSPLMARRRDSPVGTSEVTTAGDFVALNASNGGELFATASNRTGTGQLTSTGQVDIEVAGRGAAFLTIGGTFVATVVFECFVHSGANASTLRAINRATGAIETGTTNAGGEWIIPIHGFAVIRIRVSAYTSGTVFIDAEASSVSNAAAVYSLAQHDAVGTGVNPLLTGGFASDAAPTAVSGAGDAVRTWLGLKGETIVRIVDGAGDSCMDNGNDALRVNVVAGSAGGVSHTDDTAFTVASSAMVPAGGIYRLTRDLVDDGDAGALAMTQKRGLLAALETENGDQIADDAFDSLKVLGPVAVDAATTNVNPLIIGARASNATPSPVSADADAVQLRADRLGQLGVRLYDADGDSITDDANNALRVNIIAGAGSGGTAVTDDTAFTPGTTAVTPAAGTYRTTRDALDDNDVGAIALTQTRSQYVTPETPTGDSLVDDSLDTIRVSVHNSVAPGQSGGGDTITADEDAVTIPLTDGRTTVGLHISGTWTATLQFEATMDDSVWFALPVRPTGGGASVTSTAANGQFFADGAGCSSVRVRASDFTSGTATVEHLRHVSPRVYDGSQSLPAGTNNIGDVDVLSVVPGTGATNLGKAEDAAHTTGDVGVFALAVRRDTPGTGIGADGDYVCFQTDSSGNLRTSVENTVTIQGNIGAAGMAAHDSAVSGNPLLNGFEARTSDGTAVTSGDAVRGLADTLGKQVVLVGAVHDLHSRGTATYSNTTASDLIAAAGAGVRIAVMGVLVTNAHATVGTKVEVRDGTTVRIQGFAAAAGGGFAMSGGGVPLFISTANTAVTGRCVTTGSDVDITVWGYRIGN